MNNTVIVNFSQETVRELNSNNYSLFCFIGTQTPNKASPLCWGVFTGFLSSLKIQWKNNFCAYISTDLIADNAPIYIAQSLLTVGGKSSSLIGAASFSQEIELKEQMLVEDYGFVTIDRNNIEENILITNMSSTQYTAGVGISDGQNYYGTCAMNLYGNNNIRAVPSNKAFFMISTNPNIQNNTVVLTSSSTGFLIDLDGADNNTRTVEYDINLGWSPTPTGSSWGTSYPTGSELATILISPF